MVFVRAVVELNLTRNRMKVNSLMLNSVPDFCYPIFFQNEYNMQAIYLPPTSAPRMAENVAPNRLQATGIARPLPEISAALMDADRRDCAICSLMSSVPCLTAGAVLAGITHYSSFDYKSGLICGVASGVFLGTGILALISPLSYALRNPRVAPPSTLQAIPSPRYELPPASTNDHVVVEMPNRAIALGIEERSPSTNQS